MIGYLACGLVGVAAGWFSLALAHSCDRDEDRCPVCAGTGAHVVTVHGRHVAALCPACSLGREFDRQNTAQFGGTTSGSIAGNVMPIRPGRDAS